VLLLQGQRSEAFEPSKKKKNAFSEIGERWIEKYLIFFAKG
jgi:hypothetical protein